MASDFQQLDGSCCNLELLFRRRSTAEETGGGEGSRPNAATYSIVHTIVPPNRIWQTLLTWREHLADVDLSDLLLRIKYSTEPTTRDVPFAEFWKLHFLRGLNAEFRRGTLQCKFQPIVSRIQHSIFGYELLANFHDQQVDLGAQELFRHVIDQRERWGLEGLLWSTALHQLRNLPHNSLGFINLNPEIFFQGVTDWRRTERELARAAIAPARVVVELLESETPYPVGELKALVHEFRRRGFAIAIDDWGQHTGNLSILEATRPDFVKLEMQTVRGAFNDPFRRTLVEGVIDLCRSLDAKVVLEGIETADDWEWAKDSRADFLQGYHLARPKRSPVDCWQPTATINRKVADLEVPSPV